MLGQLSIMWGRVRDSLWFLPSLLTVLAAVLAFVVTRAELAGLGSREVELWWMFGGGVEGARGVLGAIASGLITVTGVVFSITVVTLQLASTQFTPRVLRNFMADRGNQTVLGVFIATFTYTLLVLRTIRSATDDGESFVPRLAVTIALVLTLVSIGCLIFFVNHVASSIQVWTILHRVSERAVRDVERLFPEPVGEEDETPLSVLRDAEDDPVVVRATRSGYLQAVDAGHLFQVGRERELVVAMEPHIGAFVHRGEVLATTWPRSAVGEETIEEVRDAFVLGSSRTPGQDVEFGILEISDIAVKALSPGINDPTTALHCIDRLAEILIALGTRRPPQAERTEAGRIHFLARHTTFERALDVAFGQVRHYAGANPDVMGALLGKMRILRELVPAAHWPPLYRHARAILRAARRGIEDGEDLARVESIARSIAGFQDTGSRGGENPATTSAWPPRG